MRESKLRRLERRRMHGKVTLRNMRFLLLVAAAFLAAARGQDRCAGCDGAGSSQAGAKPHSRAAATLTQRDPLLKALINDTDALLPEFRADILLSIAESGRVADPGLKIKLLDRAYSAAETVQPPYTEAPYGAVGSTPQGRKAIALSVTQLDRMSLQSRAVHDMQALSGSRARAMFEQIEFPVLGPLACDDNWIYAPMPFYSALAETVGNDFRPSEIASGKRLTFLQPYVSRLNSHAQVIPVAHLLATAKLTPDELRQLSPVYAAALLGVPQDGHTFGVIGEDDGDNIRGVYGGSLSGSMSALVSVMERSGAPTASLLHSLRAYLVQNFNGPRCDIAHRGQEGKKRSPLPRAVESFNQAFDGLLKANGLAPISSSELTKAAVLPTHLWEDPGDSDNAKRLSSSLRALHAALDRSTKDDQVPDSWWRDLDDFLTSFYSWQEGSEPEEDYVREKTEFYEALVEIIPKSPTRHKVLENFVSFMEQYSYQSIGGAEWFLHARMFLMGLWAKDSHEEILNAFLNSRDPVLSVYARLEVWNGKMIGPHWPAGQ